MPKIQHRDSILKAIEEYDTLGRDRFLKRYGYWPSRRYFLVHGGKLYDSKSIVGAAFGYENPSHGPLKWREFNGGSETVRCLERLGFAVHVLGKSGPPRAPNPSSRRRSLRVLRVEETTLEASLAEARHDRVVLTRNGRPIAILVSVDGMDEEQFRLSTSPEFWALMEESRRQKTIGRAELEERLDQAP